MRLFGFRFDRVCVAALLVTVLTACGGGGGGGGSSSPTTVGSPPPPPPNPTPPPPQPDPIPVDDMVINTLSGSVGDGPIVSATLLVSDKNDKTIKQVSSTSRADYVVDVEASPGQYPLIVRARGGTDLVTGMTPDFEMTSAVMRPATATTSNINPFSSLILQSALSQPRGLTENSIASARTSVMQSMNFGLDPALVGDPITTPISDENIAVMVKASETLGEMIRRTRDALTSSGVTSGDDVIEAVAADLVDGVLDGRGSDKSDSRIAAVASLASAAVLVEALTNELKVNGVDAGQAMDDAIAATTPSAPAGTTVADVRINEAMLVQALITVDAAFALTGDPVLDDLAIAISSITPGKRPSQIQPLLPANVGAALADAVAVAAFASEEELDIVNSAVRAGEPEASEATLIFFESASLSVTEGQVAEITVRRSKATNQATVNVESLDGTARAGSDYQGIGNSTISFQTGEMFKTFPIPTTDDGFEEQNEDFRLRLSAPSGGSALGAPAEMIITLVDTGTPAPDPEFFAPVIQSVVANGDEYTVSWTHPQHPPSGGYDVIVNGVDTQGAWRTSALSLAIAPLDPSLRHCFAVEARYPAASEYRMSAEYCVEGSATPVEPPPQTPPPGQPYYAPENLTVDLEGNVYALSWTHPQHPVEGGYDIFIDGVDTNAMWRTDGLAVSIDVLEPTLAHCFKVEARYPTDGQFRVSDEVCVDAVAPPPPSTGMVEAAELISVTTDGSFYTLNWSHPDHPLEGGFDIIIDGTDTNNQWRTQALSVEVGPLDASARHCFMIQARYVAEGAYPNSNEVCVDPEPAAGGTGSATVSWTPPTERIDGTPLTDLSGYRLYYGEGAGDLNRVIAIGNPGLARYVVEGLTSGDWRFAIVALDSLGQESPFSNVASKTIQ